MLHFVNDYSEGAHPKVLQALVDTNMEQLTGYGFDAYSKSAADKIRKACDTPDAEVYLISGGTQTNMIVISSILHTYEGVVAVETGHISGHEAGSIEGSGHKVLTIPAHDGKMKAEELQQFLKNFYADENHDHMVFPGMTYISHPTEYGTLYSKQELTEIYNVCKQYELPLFVDGARLGYALATPSSDVTLSDLAKLCDVFYIGGTKVGALCGEAVVFSQGKAPAHFMTHVKQKGGLLAKGRLLGVQFDTLFTDDLYINISENAIRRADDLKQILRDKGYEFFLDSPTNQIFVVLDEEQKKRLSQDVAYGFWEQLDETRTVVRFATSWATTEEQVEALKNIL